VCIKFQTRGARAADLRWWPMVRVKKLVLVAFLL
jgi:hypothetical protein